LGTTVWAKTTWLPSRGGTGNVTSFSLHGPIGHMAQSTPKTFLGQSIMKCTDKRASVLRIKNGDKFILLDLRINQA